MSYRLKLFLTFSILCVTPLLALSLINCRSALKNADLLIRNDLAAELAHSSWGFETLMREREREIRKLASGPIRSYVVQINGSPEGTSHFADNSPMSDLQITAVSETKEGVRTLFSEHPYYVNFACFAPDKHQLFLAEPAKDEFLGLRFRTKDFPPNQPQPDQRVWSEPKVPLDTIICSVVSHPSLGEVLHCSIPVPPVEGFTYWGGAFVADLRLESMVAEFARTRESSAAAEQGSSSSATIVLGPAGEIIYHTNVNYRHRPVGSAISSFAAAATSMKSGQTGSSFYVSAEGDQWLEAHAPLKQQGLSLAVARNYSAATLPARRAGWLGIALALLFGMIAAMLLTFRYQRKPQSLEDVERGVAAIAGGELNQQLLLRSSDDLRPIADSVNALTAQLREQIAREAEAHQFQSFIKLSALLTHDLKNAIGALSLIVDNMDRHFDKPEFRADTLRNLTSATDKLRALVARLSNPVNTLSGEFKRPRPTDLVPMFQRTLRQHAEPLNTRIEIEVRLPDSLFALADAERIEKVIENLIVNAVEAMRDQRGKLTVVAGEAKPDKVFFSVSDTGIGMSPAFIEKRLFRPFATTKAGGIGLGLYTCREVIRANGGTIAVDSTEGSGTTFHVVLASPQP